MALALLSMVHVRTQDSPFEPLLADLAGRIAAAVAPAQQITLTIDEAGSRAALIRLLTARGVRVADTADGAPVVRVSCRPNAREQVCVADVRGPSTSVTAFATGPSVAAAAANVGRPAVAQAAVDVRPVFSQRARILDIAEDGRRLVVLDAERISVHERTDEGWRETRAVPLEAPQPWPRDLRGRLVVDGGSYEAFLPGVTCRGRVDGLTIECAPGRRTWPIPIENGGLDPARNHFSTPEGLTLYAAAALDDGSGRRWLVADTAGTLRVLDASRKPVATVGAGDDVAPLRAVCGPDTFVAATRSENGPGDALLLFRIVQDRLVPSAPPLPLPGVVTALWPARGGATAVTHDSAGRYAAFHASLSCYR